ncbi:MAG: leucyl/phenylalanyl-tRNA--protein transferase [Halobacteriovoraceae bacterium]|nr:leucyl/phenylalanyl-tRNA--protein transferase [Halobacteriovoraceae bacterium]
MAIIQFPPIELADKDGLLALGGDLEVNSLLFAYRQGIFPWPISQEFPLAWFCPDPRGVLFADNFHVSRSFRRFLNTTSYEVKFNYDFRSVIENCANTQNRSGPAGTWITPELIQAYCHMFEMGYAYSVEVYDKGELAGGLYGVCINYFISGESMFYKKANASKFALYFLLEKLKLSGITWIDTQMVTPATHKLGAIEISRSDFFSLLNKSLERKIDRDELF